MESGLDLAAAFVPRRLFGDYVEERVNEALDSKSLVGLTSVRGDVVRLLKDKKGVLLTDGRQITADIVVLAMGNLPPRPPGGPDTWLYDSGFFIPDPWALDAFSDIDPAEPLLLIGSGLTAVDIALYLTQRGHRGPLLAMSRRGLTPRNSRRRRRVAGILARQDPRLGAGADQNHASTNCPGRFAGRCLATGVRRRTPRGAEHMERLERVQPPSVPTSSAPPLGHTSASHGSTRERCVRQTDKHRCAGNPAGPRCRLPPARATG